MNKNKRVPTILIEFPPQSLVTNTNTNTCCKLFVSVETNTA